VGVCTEAEVVEDFESVEDDEMDSFVLEDDNNDVTEAEAVG